MLTLDGSHGEGGGQVLRTALALSALTGTAFTITNIRANRDSPGLRPQHLAAVKAAAQLCTGTADGAEMGSTQLTFYPRQLKGGTQQIDIGTAGSVTLLLQSLLLPALFADKPSRITVTGGTDVDFAMPMDYFTEVLVPHVRPWCQKLEVKLLKRGYTPAGGGTVEVFVKPNVKRSEFTTWEAFVRSVRQRVPPFILHDQGTLMLVRGVSHASQTLENDRVAEQQAQAAQAALAGVKADIRIRSEYANTLSVGAGITLWSIFSHNQADIDVQHPIRLGASALGEKGLLAETVGKNAAARLLEVMRSGAPVDAHLADNLVPYLAIAGGSVRAETITAHTTTNVHVVQQFLGNRVRIEGATLTTAPRA